VAGRIKERLHRPVIAFARGNDGELKGSGRSITSVHLRDALDLVSKQHPDLILRFGGHSMAAGLTIRETEYARFQAVFEEVVSTLVSTADLARSIETDGPLEDGWMSLDSARLIEQDIWGQGFTAPLFDDTFRVDNQRLLKDRHLKLSLSKNGTRFDHPLRRDPVQLRHPGPGPHPRRLSPGAQRVQRCHQLAADAGALRGGMSLAAVAPTRLIPALGPPGPAVERPAGSVQALYTCGFSRSGHRQPWKQNA